MILILRPNKDIIANCDTFGSGTGHYGRLNEVTADDTNGIRTVNFSSLSSDLFGFPAQAASGPISSVTVAARAWGPAEIRLGLRLGIAYYRRQDVFLAADSAVVWREWWSLNPQTQASWTWGDIANLAVEVALSANYNDKLGWLYSNCSQLWVEVEYEPEVRRARILIF